MEFSYSISTRVTMWEFYRPQPLIWVEGDEDMVFYERILRDLPHKLMAAGSKTMCNELSTLLMEKDLPFVVISDGDYDILVPPKTHHQQVIRLNRYSIENYLLEREPIERLCRNYLSVSHDEDVLGTSFDDFMASFESALRDSIILDVAFRLSGSPSPMLPKNDTMEFFDERRGLRFATERIAKRCQSELQNVSPNDFTRARLLVSRYLRRRRLACLLRGHLVLGLVRRFLVSVVKDKLRAVDQRSLLLLLVGETWSVCRTRDHINLKRSVRRAVKHVRRRLVEPLTAPT